MAAQQKDEEEYYYYEEDEQVRILKLITDRIGFQTQSLNS